ncbi:MAG: DUF4214 domain-containing protein [Lachnospiraceae bacterium]|nr:DUF4214 domain-containing protein [Lachnospiraceae bacterium]
MKKRKTFDVRALSIVLSLLMVLSVITFPTLKAKADEPAKTVDDFVERCYTVTLDRPSDPDGFADWKDQLLNGRAVGIEVAYGFLFSPEYTKKNKSNEDYVTDLYMLFMGRTPDEAGYNDWVGQLNNGKSRLEVYAGFANSLEFYNLCTEYGITAGRYVPGYDRTTINNVNLFVERLYKTCLGRIGDREGQKNWVEKLITKQISGTECARSFIQSTEYVNKGLYDDNYVKNLYLAMMGRPYDDEGFDNWLNAMANGMTRDEVFAGFANSAEFANLCAKYHIEKGSYTAKDVGKPVETPQSFKWLRTSRIDYNNGDYALIKYVDFNSEISRIRYDKNGNKLGYDYRDETVNGESYYGKKYYNDDGTINSSFFSKTTISSDNSIKTEYTYTDEWNTLDYYFVYNMEQYTYQDPDGEYTSYHATKGTFYDSDGTKTGNIVYEYYPDNRLKKSTQYEAGKLYWVGENEYYDKKGYETQYVKKFTSTNYNYDGTVSTKTIDEYDENGNNTKHTYYYEGELIEYTIYEYDSKGNTTKSTTYNASNEVSHNIVYKYDYYGNKIKETDYNWGAYIGYTDYKYDSNNNLLKTINYDNNNTVVWYSGYDYTPGRQISRYYYFDGIDLYEDNYDIDADNYITKYTKSKNGSEYYWEKYTYEPCPE